MITFDPGERWQYGINIDWVGRAVEAAAGLPLEVYFRQHIFAPLGMSDTDYVISAAQRSRLVSVHHIRPQTRREFLKTTAALTASASVGAVIRRAVAQGGGAQPRQIDAVLRQAADAKEVPGVVAVAANDKGVIYEGAFGTRNRMTTKPIRLRSSSTGSKCLSSARASMSFTACRQKRPSSAANPTELSDFSVCTTWGVTSKNLFLLGLFRKRLEPQPTKTVYARGSMEWLAEQKKSG